MGRYSRSRSRSRGRRYSRSRSRSRSRSSSLEDGFRVHVGDLGIDCSKKEIERTFEKFGPINEVWVAKNPPCFAFIVYNHKEDADEAIQEMNGKVVCGNRVKVTFALPRTRGRRRRTFDPNLRCYSCGERGHFSRDCTEIWKNRRYGYVRSPTRNRRQRSRSRSHSRDRDRRRRSRSRDRRRSKSRSKSRDRRSRSRNRKSKSRSRSRDKRATKDARSKSRSTSRSREAKRSRKDSARSNHSRGESGGERRDSSRMDDANGETSKNLVPEYADEAHDK